MLARHAQSCPTLCNPMDCSLASLLGMWDSPGKNAGVGGHALLQGNLPDPGIEPESPALQVGSLQSEPPGKPPSPPTLAYAAAAKSRQSCPILCDPIDGSPPGSPVPGILQARTLEWVAISFSDAGK